MRRWSPEAVWAFGPALPRAWRDVRAGTTLAHSQERADAIIVLGCRLLPDGTASGSLRARAEHGARLFLEGRAPVLVTTGASHERPPGEAVAAAQIAESLGVPRDALRLEEKSRNTEGNFAFAKGLCPGPRILVVTEPFHMARALRIAAKYGFEPLPAPAISPAWQRPWDRVRLSARDVVSLAWWQATETAR